MKVLLVSLAIVLVAGQCSWATLPTGRAMKCVEQLGDLPLHERICET
jgi:hypothetical protein